jgi:lysophospholipase L1-like esterase
MLSRMGLGLGGLTRGQGAGGAPAGFGFLMSDDMSDFLTDPDGNRFIVESNVGNVALNTYLASLPDLNIAVFGDSHFNGPTPSNTAIGDTATAFGTDGAASPLDRMWSASGDAPLFLGNSTLASVSGSTDSNLGLSANAGSDVIAIPRLLRLSFPMRCGIIRVANFGCGGASSYSWAGELASLFTRAVANANDGDTMIIGGVTYTFRTSVSVANDVLIGASANATNQNLGRAVNAEGGTEGTEWGTGTVVNPNVFCPAASSAQYVKFCAKGTGTAGNSQIVTSSTTARIAVASTTDLSAQLTQNMASGSATSALYANAKSTLAANGGMVPDIVIAALGTNDALRTGWRSSGYETEMQKLIDNIHTDWPDAKVILWKPPTPSGGGTVTSIILPAINDLVAANSDFVSAVDMNTVGSGTGDVAVRRSDGVHLTYYGGGGLKAQAFAKAIATAQGWV